ncbi:MAG: hypothetical protein HY376_03185 [Candidatus Blackburnbacteria bacterium]|nr:hypothetical protein [Candidatus Blackburnbacteria bacterium]
MTPEEIFLTMIFATMAYFAVIIVLADWLNDRDGWTLLWGIWLPILIVVSSAYGIIKGFQWLKDANNALLGKEENDGK